MALDRLHPSEKADHRTVLEGRGLKHAACTNGTRVKILEDITKWANDRLLASPRVFWLTGQAGSGKTTIAYTIAKLFEKDADSNGHTILGGNFLCSHCGPWLIYPLGIMWKNGVDNNNNAPF